MKIKHDSVIAQISAFIRHNIKHHQWQVGQAIPSENVLSRQLGVSRASLRQAIQQYVVLGILQPKQGNGCFLISDRVDERMGNLELLSSKDVGDIRQVLEFRLLLEVPAILMLEGKSSQELAELLKKLIQHQQDMQNNIDHSAEFIRADLDFHLDLAYACGNELIGSALRHVFALTAVSHQQINQLFGMQDGLEFHAKIISALVQSDFKKASQLMHKHLTQALDALQ